MTNLEGAKRARNALQMYLYGTLGNGDKGMLLR